MFFWNICMSQIHLCWKYIDVRICMSKYMRVRNLCILFMQATRMIVLHKKVPWIMNFKNQLFHSNSFFSTNNILKFGNKSLLENIIFVSKSIIRQVSSLFYGWFSVNLDRNETCRSVTGNLNISTFWVQKYGRYI